MGIGTKILVHLLPLTPTPLLRKLSGRYIAGERLEQAIAKVRELEALGFPAILDVLGEDGMTSEDAATATRSYHEAIEAQRREGLDAYVSIKPTHVGLRQGRDVALANYRSVLENAAQDGTLVRVEMEDTDTLDETLAVFQQLRTEFENVGLVLQVYLRRTLEDLARLLSSPGKGRLNVRLCKGIYLPPYSKAYQDAEIVRQNFQRGVQMLLEGGGFASIATHDERVFYDAVEYCRRTERNADDYEFEMLLGVMEHVRDVWKAQGEPIRVYVPYGPQWRPYSLRRLRRNPTLLRHIMKATFLPRPK